MLKLKRATSVDAVKLTKLSIESEATWGFDREFMEIFRATYEVSHSFIENNLVYMMLDAQDLIGFFALVKDECISTLEYFYIAPDYIRKGYGKKMWAFLIDVCGASNIDMIEFVTSPEASPFYTVCGAKLVETAESRVIKGRMIPKFRVNINSGG